MSKQKTLEPALIRIVDDDLDVRESLKLMLECEGWQVSAYASAQDFLKDFDSCRPGCLLLDVRLPGLSGPELQERLISVGSRLPIVFITSYADIQTAIETLKAGAADFLLKPVDPDKLLDVVERVCSISRLDSVGVMLPPNLRYELERLSDQPRKVLGFMLEGMNDAQIAERMGLSERTIQVYRSNVYKCVGVHSVQQFSLLIPHIREILNTRNAADLTFRPIT